MLTQLIESFATPPECVDELRTLISDYHSFMLTYGFLGQKYDLLVESVAPGRFLVGGLLTHGDFPPTGIGLSKTSKKSCNHLLAKREDIKRLATEVDVQLFNVTDSQDDHYCNHNTWSGLVLCADWPMSVTPIRCCDCGGLVARYRVPRNDVWDWQVGSDCVEVCWSASGVFEAWGNGERHDPLSRLNTLGLSIVKNIQSETGIATWLYISARMSTSTTTCPLCGNEMSSLVSRFFWNYACHDCRIVTALDDVTLSS